MKLKVGIAGYGLAGRSFHAPILSGTNFEVAAVLTTNDVRKRHAKEDFPTVGPLIDSQSPAQGHK